MFKNVYNFQNKLKCGYTILSNKTNERILNSCALRSNNKFFSTKNFLLELKFNCFRNKKRCFSQSNLHEKLSLKNPVVMKHLKQLSEEFIQLQNEELGVKRCNELRPLILLWQQRIKISEDLETLDEEMKIDSTDKELILLAEEEKKSFMKNIAAVDQQILELLLPPEEFDTDPNSLVLEVYAGVGGQEAMLFAGELMNMYENFIEFQGWEQDNAELGLSELGGLRHGSICVSGTNAYRKLRHEAGVHRVQRVPKTEKQGRLHTSTVTVAILPQPMEVEIVIHPKDVKIETKRASGAGGQHVNTTDSAVRLVHIPTGLAVECQSERSQVQNRQKAMQRLSARLYQKKLEEQQLQTRNTRKHQIGSNFRSDKIRTYNYPQDRISDHRVGITLHNLRGFMTGGEALQEVLRQLEEEEHRDRLRSFIASIS